jgi:endonuclease-3
LIRWVNYSKTKAKHIYQTSLDLVTSYQLAVVGSDNKQPTTDNYYIPNTLSELTKLPGVGVKTAKVVLAVLYKQPYIAVDTHVHRVAHRLWRVSWLNPEKTSEALEKLIPDSYKDLAHRVMIYFGRHLCKSQNPRCEECPLQQYCLYYKGLL